VDDRKKTAALTSLRADAGLAPVLPYIARWIGEGVITSLRRDSVDGEDVDFDRKSLDIYLDAISALLENDRLFIEPYVCLRRTFPSHSPCADLSTSCINSSRPSSLFS